MEPQCQEMSSTKISHHRLMTAMPGDLEQVLSPTKSEAFNIHDASSSEVVASDLLTSTSPIIAPGSRTYKSSGITADCPGAGACDRAAPSPQMSSEVVVDSDTPTASDSEGLVSYSGDSDGNSGRFPSSMEESFHELPDSPSFPNCTVQDATRIEDKSLDSSGDKTASSGNDSGYGLHVTCSAASSPQLNFSRSCGMIPASPCRHCSSATTFLTKELHKVKRELNEKDAALAGLKDAVTKQYVEKEDLLLQKIKSDSDLKVCEQQLDTTRKSEMRYRKNFYQNSAELNALQREVLSLHGEVTSRKILANKLQAEMMQSSNVCRNHCCPPQEKEKTFMPSLEEPKICQVQNQDMERIVRLEKQMELLQDEKEDLRFKAQRYAEEAASLSSQNSQLVKQCGSLQGQLVECLATISVLDVRSNDAESKLKRARVALEVKEKSLFHMSSEHTADLLKIEEKERELERVRNEMANVTRNFMKLSDIQRDLKENLLYYKNVIEARDAKIRYLNEERNNLLRRLETYEEELLSQNKSGNFELHRTSKQFQPLNLSDEKSKELQKNLDVVDVTLSEQIGTLKQENQELALIVRTLREELNTRCVNSISKMVKIMEIIERLEEDMGQFLEHECQSGQESKPALAICLPTSTNQAEGEPCPEPISNRDTAQLLRENLELAQSLATAKLEVDALRQANNEMENLKKQDVGEKAQQTDARQTSPMKNLNQGKVMTVSIEPTLLLEVNGEVRDLETPQEYVEDSLEKKVDLLEKANSELVSYIDNLHRSLVEKQSCEKKDSKQLWQIPEKSCRMLSGSFPLSAGDNLDELNRIGVFLQICLMEILSIVSRESAERERYGAIISGLEGVLLSVRSVNTLDENPEGVCKLGELIARGVREDEPDLVPLSQTELEGQIAESWRIIQSLKKALAVIEEERRRDQQLHKSQMFDLVNKFRLRLKEKESLSVKNADPIGNKKLNEKVPSRSQHSVCTDMVVNLERDLRSSRQIIHNLQVEISAKNEETWRLNQEISSLRSELNAVHDILDNKKIALGRSEAIGQMLRVSETGLENRLELEQREHENCRQELDRSLEETRAKTDEIKELCRRLVEKDQELSEVHQQFAHLTKEQEELLRRCQEKEDELKCARNRINAQCCDGRLSQEHKMVAYDADMWQALQLVKPVIPPPSCISNEAELRALIERTEAPRRDVTGQLKQSVSHMTGDVHFLVRHFIKGGKDD